MDKLCFFYLNEELLSGQEKLCCMASLGYSLVRIFEGTELGMRALT
jgi:hypothetical protein